MELRLDFLHILYIHWVLYVSLYIYIYILIARYDTSLKRGRPVITMCIAITYANIGAFYLCVFIIYSNLTRVISSVELSYRNTTA